MFCRGSTSVKTSRFALLALRRANFSDALSQASWTLIAFDLKLIRLARTIPLSRPFTTKRGALPSPLRRYDQVMVLECGTDVSTSPGFDGLYAWFSKPLTSLADLFREKPRADADALQAKIELVKFMIDQQEV